ncbi:MAG: septation protein IspZ [Alphaproteobacteria bacterium]|nr:septation protein IspZ [Alphaproteobacteria bacterium]
MKLPEKISPQLRLTLDFGPIVVFLATYWFAGIYWATGVIMVVATLAVLVNYLIERKLAPVPVFTLTMVMIFGGLTLYLQDSTFIKVRPTIYYTIVGVILLGGLMAGQSFLQLLLGAAIKFKDEGWRILTFRYAALSFLLAVMNEIVWRNFEEGTWVVYNAVGDTVLLFAFLLSQIVMLRNHLILEDEAGDPGDRDKDPSI